MISINGKNWEKLRISDIDNLLESDNDESFFFEFKNDGVDNIKLIKEISAFSNTYGGYILIGVDDDKSVSGCKKWNEQRIHSTIHDCISPIPNFDIKKFKTSDEKIIFAIKIDEGTNPPYVTNDGKIYERVSSGSFPIKDSNKLTQLYYKRQENYKKIENKISIPDIIIDNTMPNNFCGYLDLGFVINCSNLNIFQKQFFDIDLKEVSKILKKSNPNFSISRVGYSIVITIGEVKIDGSRDNMLTPAGMNNFIEIMCDGSIRCRTVLATEVESNFADIMTLFIIGEAFADIYRYIVGEKFYKNFINAYKYEKLTVFKQFKPFLKLRPDDKHKSEYDMYVQNHSLKYGNNLIVVGNRVPKNEYLNIDKQYFDNFKLKYNNETLIHELFRTNHILLGFIDNISETNLDEDEN